VHRRSALLVAALLAAQGCGRAENSLLLLDQLPEVASISIEGNRAVSDGTLKQLMTLREGTWWNPFQEHKYRHYRSERDPHVLHAERLSEADRGQSSPRIQGKVHVVITVDGPAVGSKRHPGSPPDPENRTGLAGADGPYGSRRSTAPGEPSPMRYWEAVVEPADSSGTTPPCSTARGDPVRLGT
jgi:hypothetical protein